MGRTLFSATAEFTLGVGWMAYDAGKHGLAQRYMAQALRMAHAANDRAFGGRILAAMSHQRCISATCGADSTLPARHAPVPKAQSRDDGSDACRHGSLCARRS